MSEPKFFEPPKKVPGGVIVSVWFKTFNEAFTWMSAQGMIGHNSAVQKIQEWEDSEHRSIMRESRGLRKKLKQWLSRT